MFPESKLRRFRAVDTGDHDLIADGARSVAPWPVRIVENYLEANWDRPVTIEEIARETGVGVRSLFLSFKKARGYSPMSFLLRVRLYHARRMLEAPNATTSVTSVRSRCGFKNASHFARYYRAAFGELPSTTLAMAIRARTATAANRDNDTEMS